MADKAKVALAHGVTPIVCVGETRAEREAGQTEAVVKRQLPQSSTLGHCCGEMVVAYEPVWAIGAGLDRHAGRGPGCARRAARAVACRDRKRADGMRILYGGSVKPDNATEFFGQADIDGGLIGGAALKAADFAAICRAASA